MSDTELPTGPGAGRNAGLSADSLAAERERAYTYHDLLATPRRAVLLDVLGDRSMIHMTELVDHVAEEEFGPDYDSADRKKVYIGYYQTHLSVLDEAAVIDYDEDTREIERGERYEDIRAFQKGARRDFSRVVRAAMRVDAALRRARATVREVVDRAH